MIEKVVLIHFRGPPYRVRPHINVSLCISNNYTIFESQPTQDQPNAISPTPFCVFKINAIDDMWEVISFKFI